MPPKVVSPGESCLESFAPFSFMSFPEFRTGRFERRRDGGGSGGEDRDKRKEENEGGKKVEKEGKKKNIHIRK